MPSVDWFSEREEGISLIETVVALAIMGIVAVVFLSGLCTAYRATSISDERTTADSLVISEIEYVKRCTYLHSASEYPVDPALNIPAGWSVPPPIVELVHATDDGIQEVFVKAEHNGEEILILSIHKVDR